MHRLVADWYEAHDDISAAIHHRVAARQYGEAIDLIHAHTRQFYDAGRGATVRAWWQSIPPGQLGGEPWDLVERAVNLPPPRLAGGDGPARAGRRRAAGEAGCRDIAAAGDHPWRHGQRQLPAARGSRRSRPCPRTPGGPLRSAATPGWNACRWFPGCRASWWPPGQCIERFDEAEAAAHTPLPAFADGQHGGAATVRRPWPSAPWPTGQLGEAERLVDRATSLAGALGMPDDHVNMLPVMGTRGGLLRERNRLDEAERLLETVVAMASDEYPRGNRFRLRAIVELARLWSAHGRTHEALALLDDAAEELDPVAARAGVGRRPAGAPPGIDGPGGQGPSTADRAARAALLGARGGPGLGRRRRPRCRPTPSVRPSPSATPGGCWWARWSRRAWPRRRGDGRTATEHLQRAITVGAREGFVRTLLDFDPPIDRLLTTLPVGPVDYVESLARADDDQGSSTSATRPTWSST